MSFVKIDATEFVRVLASSDRVILLEKQLYIYNKTQGSAMTKFGTDRFDSIKLFEDLENFFCETCRNVHIFLIYYYGYIGTGTASHRVTRAEFPSVRACVNRPACWRVVLPLPVRNTNRRKTNS